MSNRQHWYAWFWTCLTALLPLGLWFLIHWLTGDRTHPTAEVAREFLYFTLSICGLSLAEFRHLWRRGSSTNSANAFNWCLVITIVVAVLYGAFLTGEALHASVVIRNAYRSSIYVALIALGLGTWVQRQLQRERSYVA